MIRRCLFLAAFVLAFAPLGSAQIISVYGTFNDTQFSNVQSTVPTSSTGTYQTTNYWAPGFAGGVTLGILPVGPVHIGLDVRGSTKPGTSGGDTGFAGFRIGLKLPVIRVKPYIQASGGYVETRTPVPASTTTTTSTSTSSTSTITNQYAGYEVIGGIDYPLMHFIDFRVIEVGGGKAYNINTSTYAVSSISLLTINTGVVFHF